MDHHLQSLYYAYKSRNHKKEFLPENTIEDIGVNDFFCFSNYTSSRIGEQYLYYLLHSAGQSDISKYEYLIEKLSKDDDFRIKQSVYLSKLSHPDVYSVVNLFSKEIPVSSNRKRWILYVCRFLPFLFSGLFFVSQLIWVLIPLICAIILNMFFHYQYKSKIYSYFFSVPQLIKLIRQAEVFVKESFWNDIQKDISQTLTDLKPLKKTLSTLRLNIRLENDMAILVYMFAELVHILFLTEAYSVSKSLLLLQNRQKEIEKVFCFIGFIDVLCSISSWRQSLPYYCFPQNIVESKKICAKGIYHPLIKNAVSNDFNLVFKSAVITGSNMSGKTSFMRTIGINLLSAKVLNTCFASEFKINIHMRLASAIHICDSLSAGKSYFLQEVEYIKELIACSVEGNCLFLIDEPFKGTNTAERIAIGKAVLSALAKGENIVITSTHDAILGELLEDNYNSFYFCESIKDNLLSFDYKLKLGVTTERNAIKILEIYQYPSSIIADAYEYCKNIHSDKNRDSFR